MHTSRGAKPPSHTAAAPLRAAVAAMRAHDAEAAEALSLARRFEGSVGEPPERRFATHVLSFEIEQVTPTRTRPAPRHHSALRWRPSTSLDLL